MFGTYNDKICASDEHMRHIALSIAVRGIQLGFFLYWLQFIYTAVYFHCQSSCPCHLYLCAQTRPDPHILLTASVNVLYPGCVCAVACAMSLTCAQNQLVLGWWSSWVWENDNGVIEEAGWMRGRQLNAAFTEQSVDKMKSKTWAKVVLCSRRQ